MTTAQVAQLFNAKRIGRGKYIARCPAHPDRKPSLSIDEGKSWTLLYCRSHGCETREILSKMGIAMSDLSYSSRLSPNELRELSRKKRDEELRSHNFRVGEWILRFIERGYTLEDRNRDLTTVEACRYALSQNSNPRWESILRIHSERIEAAEHCRQRRMLPNV